MFESDFIFLGRIQQSSEKTLPILALIKYGVVISENHGLMCVLRRRTPFRNFRPGTTCSRLMRREEQSVGLKFRDGVQDF